MDVETTPPANTPKKVEKKKQTPKTPRKRTRKQLEKENAFYIELENVLPEDIEPILKKFKTLESRNDNENYQREIGKVQVNMVEKDRVRIKLSEEEKKNKRRIYLREDYNKRPNVIAKRKEYLSREDIKKKRQEYTKLEETKLSKKRNLFCKSNILKDLKKDQPDYYKSHYLTHALRFDEELEKKKQEDTTLDVNQSKTDTTTEFTNTSYTEEDKTVEEESMSNSSSESDSEDESQSK